MSAELIDQGVEEFSHIHELINSVWNKDGLPEGWKGSIIVPFYRLGSKSDCSNYSDISGLATVYKIFPASCCQGLNHMQRKLLCISSRKN
jgi:hypothetical protein